MAIKRMFSAKIVDSDAFLDMPQTSQLLYFHLAMRVDDDGFVGNPKKIMRMIGSNSNDLSILLGKKFIIGFESGVIVIKHHRMNNNWDSHNCKRTQYTEEFGLLNVKENGSYTLDKKQGVLVQSEYSLITDGKQSLEENRIEENRIDIPIWLNKKAWGAWEQHRKEKKKKLTPTSMKLQIKLLEANKEDHVQIIKNSITNGWTGLFPIKKDQFVKKTPPRFIEPSTTKEDNDRRNLLNKQSEELANKFKV